MLSWDIEELAYRAMGKTEEQEENEVNNGDIEQAIFDTYDCDFSTYQNIVNDLIKFTPILSSPLSGEKFHAFVDTKQERAIVKLKVEG